MCGIAGVLKLDRTGFSSRLDVRAISLLQGTGIRGDDSYGVFTDPFILPNPNNIVGMTHKNTQQGFRSISPPVLFEIVHSCIAVVANSRAYPTQEYITNNISVDDLQPFESYRFVVVHNGIISNDKAIASEWKIVTKTRTDTAVIPGLLEATSNIPGITQTGMLKLFAKTFQNQVEGSFAMIIYDKLFKQMYAVTNFMPLYYSYNVPDKTWYIYSEPEMFEYRDTLCLDGKWIHGTFEPYTVSTIIDDKLVSESFRKQLNNPKKVLISFSGGNDSMVNARLYQSQGYDVNLVHFKYGQRAEEREEFATRKIAENWGMGLHVIDVRNLFAQISENSILLNSTFKLPKDKRTLDMESTLSYVANRNAIFGNIAAGLAEQIGAGIVVVNANLGDSVYPDNNYPFLRAMENLFNYSLNWHSKVRFTSPLINLEKHEIIKLGLYLYGDFFNTVSCYYPEWDSERGVVVNCGNCGCCLYRERAFKMTGVVDPQPYRKNTVDWDGCEELSTIPISYRDLTYGAFALRPSLGTGTAYTINSVSDKKMKSILERAVLFL